MFSHSTLPKDWRVVTHPLDGVQPFLSVVLICSKTREWLTSCVYSSVVQICSNTREQLTCWMHVQSSSVVLISSTKSDSPAECSVIFVSGTFAQPLESYWRATHFLEGHSAILINGLDLLTREQLTSYMCCQIYLVSKIHVQLYNLTSLPFKNTYHTSIIYAMECHNAATYILPVFHKPDFSRHLSKDIALTFCITCQSQTAQNNNDWFHIFLYLLSLRWHFSKMDINGCQSFFKDDTYLQIVCWHSLQTIP